MFSHRQRLGSVDLAFTDRFGGVSESPYDELDLALDDTGREEERATNWSRVLAEFAPGAARADMRQVHGNRVVTVAAPAETPPECDALVTTAADVVLVVRCADCVPVLLADPEAGVVAAAHVGRVGLRADVLGRAVDQMVAAGADDISAHVGPHVCGRCYEVPEAMRDDVDAFAPGSAATTSWGTPALDLAAGVRHRLGRSGVTRVHEVGVCTVESSAHYSHRRDAERSGRHVGLIVRRGGAR